MRPRETSAELNTSLPPSLTARQAEVVRLTVQGLGAKECARVLGISRRTVEDHLTAAKDRAGVATRVELITWAVRNGIT